MTTSAPRKKTSGSSKIKRRPAETAPVRETAPIIPNDTVTGRALIAVVAIMTFLAALTVGSIVLVRDAASHWRSDLSQEITIQIRAHDGKSIEDETARAAAIAKNFPGISDIRILNAQETGSLLEPWLGRGLDLGSLPVPRLIVARVVEDAEADISKLQAALKEQVPTATLDDHRGWTARMSAFSDGILLAGAAILFLVLSATVLSVVFATRSAVTGNRAIVEVLHFVGARDSYIANVFQRHFLLAGLKGAAAGGAAGCALFALAAVTPDFLNWMPGAGNSAILFGKFVLHPAGYIGILTVVLLVVLITTFTSRFTVYRTIRSID